MMLQSLLDIVFPPRESELCVRACTPEKMYAILAPTLLERTTPESVGLLPFKEEVVRAIIHEAKYHHNTRAYELLADVLALYISEHALDQDQLGSGSYALVPMPLGSKRFKERGYNQVEEVVQRVSVRLDIPVARCLLKIRDTESQTKLSRLERIENQSGVFTLMDIDPDTTYILVDDVITTGATMQSACSAFGTHKMVPVALGF